MYAVFNEEKNDKNRVRGLHNLSEGLWKEERPDGRIVIVADTSPKYMNKTNLWVYCFVLTEGPQNNFGTPVGPEWKDTYFTRLPDTFSLTLRND